IAPVLGVHAGVSKQLTENGTPMLTSLQCEKAKPLFSPSSSTPKAAKLYDSGGLYLLVKPNGSKLWRFKYRVRVGGQLREKLLALGNYEQVSLKEARAKRDTAKKLLSEGID